MDSVTQDWKDLENELSKFQKNHKDYVKKLEEVETMKKNYLAQFIKLKKKLNGLEGSIDRLQKTVTEIPEESIPKPEPVPELPPAQESETKPEPSEDANNKPVTDANKLIELKTKVNDNLNYMRQISDTFPRPNNLYLKVILGNVCVSILNKEEKWKYKEEYEKFKYTVTMISMCFAFFLIFVTEFRALDACYNFLLVWYYCTLTIREAILCVNGSKIQGWWQAHHFISTICTAILLIWPDSESYNTFRNQFIWFSFYISFVQLLQYYYQKGCLYRLRALGEKEDMSTTVEGFQFWMLRGLSFLLPFLFAGYFFELYNSYTLLYLSLSEDCHEWHVFVLCIIFFVLFAGNFVTTYIVIRKKLKDRIGNNISWIRYKYADWKKLQSPGEKNE